jgi:hypothetical protein
MRLLLLSFIFIISINTLGQTIFSYRNLEKMNRLEIINLAKEKIDNFVKQLMIPPLTIHSLTQL